MSDFEQAPTRFRMAQEKLKQFIEENMEYTINGLEFADERNRETLARELDALRAEHEAAGEDWAASLPVTAPQ